MQPGIDTTNPFSADAQAPESVGSGEVGAPPAILLQPVMAGTGMVEKKPMNWKHFGWGVGITIGYFVLFGILGAITDGMLMSTDGEGSMTIATDGNTTHFEVELPVEPDTCELWFSADEGSLWADAYSDCDESIMMWQRYVIVGYANGSQSNWSVNIGNLQKECGTTLFTHSDDYHERNCNGRFEGVVGSYDQSSGWLNVSLPTPVANGTPLMLQYTIGDHERYVIGNVSGNRVTLDWPYPVQEGGGIRVEYREQGAFGGEGGLGGGLVSVLGFIFNPCFVLAAVAGVAAMKGMPHVATGIGAVFATGIILFLGMCVVLIISFSTGGGI
ncbi:MAG: hypothetical protein CXX72_01730 [Methanobacteriota archaeon]|nr:MAG: hypothetical protein CXX72_01730 [Euryarchaeota archaeon]